MKRRRIAAGVLAGALSLGATITSAGAVEGPRLPTSPTTTAAREIVSHLTELIGKVEASPIPEPAKGTLLTRLREARNTWSTGGTVPLDRMQALLRDVATALGREIPTGDRPTSTTRLEEPERRTPPVSAPSPLLLLDRLVDRVKSSTLTDAAKAALLERIEAVRAKIAAGQALSREELGQLAGLVEHALEPAHRDGDGDDDDDERPAPPVPSAPPAPPTAPAPHERRAADAIDHAARRISESDLPAEIKERVLDQLAQAKAQVEAHQDAGGNGHEVVDAHVQARLAELREKLTKVSSRLHTLLDEAATAHPDEPALEDLRGALARADEAIAGATTATELRAAWLALREVRVKLNALMKPPAPATPTTPSTGV